MIRLTLNREGERQERYYSTLRGVIEAYLASFHAWDSIDLEFGVDKIALEEIFEAV